MDTAFRLICDGWLDQHMPLQYEFRVKVYLQTCQGEDCRIETVDSTLGGRQMGKSKVTTLPPGNPENGLVQDHERDIAPIDDRNPGVHKHILDLLVMALQPDRAVPVPGLATRKS